MKNILVVDDDVDICLLLERFLSKNGYEVTSAHSGNKAIETLKRSKFDLVLTDFRLGDLDGLELLSKIKDISPQIPVIFITGYSDIKMAVNVIKSGAFDYITKPLLPDEILHIIRKALDHKNDNPVSVPQKVKKTYSNLGLFGEFVIGESSVAKELFRQIALVAPTNYSVIICGESGTGKESVARMIHQQSPRKDMPFIAMDCGALSKELAGSELFGHEKGSFTGAMMAKIGHFELANGGTLLLDEIGNLSYDIQASLLRVVQERKLKRIGGTKEIDLDVRIIVATNENLAEAFQKGKFREDLYHRFNEFGINIPPLRERSKDILIFANHFLEEANYDLAKEIKTFSEDVINSFMTYPWPGNLRELKNVIKRAALLTDGDTIHSKALPVEIANNKKFSFQEREQSYNQNNTNNNNNNNNGNGSSSASPNLKNIALEAEYEMIMNVLRQVNFNKTKAAKILNIDRKTLYNKMKAFNI